MLAFTIWGVLLTALYFYLTRTFNYWTKRGVKHDTPIPFFGTTSKNFLLVANFLDTFRDQYKKYSNEKLIGFFRGSTPELLIKDPELAKCVLVNDFNCFHRRGAADQTKLEPLMKHLGAADDDLWRQLRLRLTPAFSSGKLKAMFPHIQQCAESLQIKVQSIAAGQQVSDARDLIMRYANDIIVSVGFGIVSDSLHNDEDPMRQLGVKLLSLNFKLYVIQLLKSLMPKVFKNWKIYGDMENDVIDLIETVMKQRNYEPGVRQDFVDTLLEYRKQGAMTGDSIIEVNADGTPKKVSIEMDESIMAAQCGFFFVAGFEPASVVGSYLLHQLAYNPHVQIKAQEEIDTILSKYGNKLCYDAIMEMTYLKWCFNESMRIFPPGGWLRRKSVCSYTFPGTNVTIDPDTIVVVLIDAIMNDPEIFPESNVYRPERFDPAVMTPIQKLAYMPFGIGPRGCIAKRLGTLMVLAGVAALLSRFSVRPGPGATRYPKSGTTSGPRNRAKALPVIFQERQDLRSTK